MEILLPLTSRERGAIKYTYLNLLTGSENIVRICDAYAKNASKLKMTMLIVLYTGYGLGNIMTTITTNSAYKISSHVIIAHIMPHMSYLYR